MYVASGALRAGQLSNSESELRVKTNFVLCVESVYVCAIGLGFMLLLAGKRVGFCDAN